MRFLGLAAILAASLTTQRLQAGIVILEGSDAAGVHCGPGAAQTYTNQLLAALKGTSIKPVLVLSNFGGGCAASSSVLKVVTGSLGAAFPAFNTTNYSGLYIMSPGGCCADGRTLVSAADQAAIAAFRIAGGSVGIMDFQGGDWTIALGFTAPPATVGGFGPPRATAPGSFCFDGNTVTAAGTSLGFTAAPTLGCFGHQAYDMVYFGGIGFTALINPPAGALFPPGFATVIAFLCPPPTISGASASPDSLWPPNHKMVTINVSYLMTSDCGGACTLSVSSNEVANGLGDGNTEIDWQVVNANTVQVRAERSGNLVDRIYTITITCTNAGGTTTKSVKVTVPHD